MHYPPKSVKEFIRTYYVNTNLCSNYPLMYDPCRFEEEMTRNNYEQTELDAHDIPV